MMKKLSFHLILLSSLYFGQAGNVGINTATPKKTLHVNGSLQITNELATGGDAAIAGNAGLLGQVLKSNGPGAAPTWQELVPATATGTGTVISINGKLIVAQEITALMTSDYTLVALGTPMPIGNLNNEIIDNENRYSGSATGNSFTVTADGTYQIMMNAQLSSTFPARFPVIGVWDDTTGNWIARVNDEYLSSNTSSAPLQTYTLITAVPMLASHIYSFRVSNTEVTTVKAISSGSTGSGPVTFASIKRLK